MPPVLCFSFGKNERRFAWNPTETAWNMERGVLQTFCCCALVFSLRKTGSDAEEVETTTGQNKAVFH